MRNVHSNSFEGNQSSLSFLFSFPAFSVCKLSNGRNVVVIVDHGEPFSKFREQFEVFELAATKEQFQVTFGDAILDFASAQFQVALWRRSAV